MFAGLFKCTAQINKRDDQSVQPQHNTKNSTQQHVPSTTKANMVGSNRSIDDNLDEENEAPHNARIDRHDEERRRRQLTKEQGQEQCQQDQDLTHRRGGGSVVHDHRSPFSGGDHLQDSTSTSRGHDNGSFRRHRHQNAQTFRGRNDRFLQDQQYQGYHRHRQRHEDSGRRSSDSSDDDDSSQCTTDGNVRYRSRDRDRQHHRKRQVFEIETEEVDLRKKAMSYRSAPREQQKHIVERIAVVVKGPIFRKMKIITSEKMFADAMRIIVEAEDPDDEDDFVRIYKTCLVGGINAKRSTCEQAGQRIVKKLLIRKGYTTEVDLDPPYSLETLVKLRQSSTDEEKEAFLWFIGDFIASVVGTKVWGRKKYYHRVSEAVIDKGGQDLVVTVSDEAFAILIYENYIDKWIAKFHMEQRGEKAIGMIKGKYTSSVNDECLYGGWSTDGIARFNELCAIVKNDRLNEGAKEAEDAVLLALRREKFGEDVDNESIRDPQEERRHRTVPVAIQAFCEL
jgi:hypothetical protein